MRPLRATALASLAETGLASRIALAPAPDAADREQGTQSCSCGNCQTRANIPIRPNGPTSQVKTVQLLKSPSVEPINHPIGATPYLTEISTCRLFKGRSRAPRRNHNTCHQPIAPLCLKPSRSSSRPIQSYMPNEANMNSSTRSMASSPLHLSIWFQIERSTGTGMHPLSLPSHYGLRKPFRTLRTCSARTRSLLTAAGRLLQAAGTSRRS